MSSLRSTMRAETTAEHKCPCVCMLRTRDVGDGGGCPERCVPRRTAMRYKDSPPEVAEERSVSSCPGVRATA